MKRKISVEYIYLEPKTPQEKEEQKRRISTAYTIIFQEVVAISAGKEGLPEMSGDSML